LKLPEGSGYFSAPASKLPTFAPPDFVTNDVKTGIAFATSSGLRPSLENAYVAAASPPADFVTWDNAPASTAGAAPSSDAIPGTAPAT
jgi:hypothetical protein